MANELHDACERGNVNKVKELLKNGCKANIYSKTGLYPIYCAAKNAHFQVVADLLNIPHQKGLGKNKT